MAYAISPARLYYAEAAYTPVLAFATPGDATFLTTGGARLLQGQYTRVGNLVNFSAQAVFQTTYTTASGSFRISLPFTAANVDPAAITFSLGLATNVPVGANNFLLSPVGTKNTSIMVIPILSTAGAVTVLGTALMPSGATEYNIAVSGTYRAVAL